MSIFDAATGKFEKAIQELREIWTHYSSLIEHLEATGNLYHPDYGSCDGLGEGGACAECKKRWDEFSRHDCESWRDQGLNCEKCATVLGHTVNANGLITALEKQVWEMKEQMTYLRTVSHCPFNLPLSDWVSLLWKSYAAFSSVREEMQQLIATNVTHTR